MPFPDSSRVRCRRGPLRETVFRWAIDAKRRLASILLVARMPREGLPEVVEFLLDARAFYMENRQFPAPSPPERSVAKAIASGRVTRPTLDLRQY